MTKIIDGKALAKSMREALREKIAALKEDTGKECGLAVVMCGENPASKIYVRNKIRACEEVGIKSYAYHLEEDTDQFHLNALIEQLALDKKVNGILVQLPLPKHIDENEALSLIPTYKDVDGFSAENVGNLLLGKKALTACTPSGVMEMLKSSDIEIAGKHAVVVGRSNIVGKPMALLLLAENATVTICHSKTKNLAEITKSADILIACVGRANFITGNMVKEGAAVIDVGINKLGDRTVGDVDFESVSKKTSYISPVPGGVGPMTITMLLYNTFAAAQNKF